MTRSRTKKRKVERQQRDEPTESEGIYRVGSLSEFIVEDEEEMETGNEEESYDPKREPEEQESLQQEGRNKRSNFNNMRIDAILDRMDSLPPNKKREYSELCKEIESETPTIDKIMNSNITRNDKKECLKLFEQFNNTEEYGEDYYRLIGSINEILSKGSGYTKEEIQFLEKEEDRLKNMYVSNDNLKTKILKLEADSKIKSKLLNMYEIMLTYPSDNSTYQTLREKIEWGVRLPYQKREVEDYVNMNKNELGDFYIDVRKTLDKNLFGMDKVKERILHILNDRRSSGDACGRNICLVGNPGTGKSKICKVLAKILNKKFGKISAASIDKAAIKGSNQVWVGSTPSIILQILADLKTNNALIMVDEAEKMDIAAQQAFLHASDASDNREFQDNFLNDFSHDLSKVMFIFNANTIEKLDPAFLDRLDVIYVDDYTNEEKLEIFKNYMLPEALTNLGMKDTDIIVADNAIKKLLDEKNIGLRNVEKIIKDLVGKVNMYRNVPESSLKELNMSYKITNFKLPLKIDQKLFFELIQ